MNKSSVESPTPAEVKASLLLGALTAAERGRWIEDLQFVEMPLGMVLAESNETMTHVYFPTTSIVSLLYVMDTGASAEVAVVGNEGIVGISIFMGGGSATSRVVVQSGGHGFRLPAAALKVEFDRCAPVMHLILRYTQALIAQMSQTTVCNRQHTVDQQLCRWLLLSMGRLEGDQLVITEGLIGNMLGVRREGVTEATNKLRDAKLIRYARGKITVLNRPGIEERVCECYAIVKDEYDRLLPVLRAAK